MWLQRCHRTWVTNLGYQPKRILQGSINQHQRNIMSSEVVGTAKPQQLEWLVILPDHDGALEKRLKVRGYVNRTYDSYSKK